jgi:hypothetical protein
MLSILPPEAVEQLLAAIPCPICDRKFGSHTDKERETCHDYAVAPVTLLKKVEGHNFDENNNPHTTPVCVRTAPGGG